MEIFLRIPATLMILPLLILVSLLLLVPIVGPALILLTGPLWLGPLINFFMIGLFAEPIVRQFAPPEARVSLFWTIFPLVYIGWYGVSYYQDRLAFENIQTEFDQINVRVSIPFDPSTHSLVFDETSDHLAEKFVTHFGVPKVFLQNSEDEGNFHSITLLDGAACERFRDHGALKMMGKRVSSFRDGDSVDWIGRRGKIVTDFCLFTVAEEPRGELVAVSQSINQTRVFGLPGSFSKTVVISADGSEHIIRGGMVSLLPIKPIPIGICAPDGYGGDWGCGRGFMREDSTPVISGEGQYGRESDALAKAFELKKVSAKERTAPYSDATVVKIENMITDAIEADLAYYRSVLADPKSKPELPWEGVVRYERERLAPFAPTIVEGIVKAAAAKPTDPDDRSEEGLRLARLFDDLPNETQDQYEDTIADLFRNADEAGDGRHWLYKTGMMKYRKYNEPTKPQYAPPSLLPE